MNFGVSTQAPNPQAMAAYQGVLNQAGNVNQIPYQMYQGQQIAGFSPDQMAAMQGVRESQGIALPFVDAASTAVGRAMNYSDPTRFNQQELSRYFDPYQQNVIDATMANMREMNASQQNQLTGNAIQQGYLGGDRAGIARAELARQQAMTNNSTLAQLQNQGYQAAVDQYNKQQQTAIGAQQAGAYSLGALGTQAQNSVMQGLQALAASGAQQQELQQKQLTADYENWQRAMGYPYQQTQWNAGITGAIAPNMGGTTTSFGMGENSKTEPGPSVGGQVAGLLTSGLSLLPKFGDGGRVGKEDGGALSYMTPDNPFEDPRRKWEEGQKAWMSANADEQLDPTAVMRAAGGSLADPLAKRESNPFGGDDSWIPNLELHPAAPQFPAPAKMPDLDTGGGGGGEGGGGDIAGSLGKLGGALASKFGGHKAPVQLPSAAHAAPTPEGATVAPPAHTADDDKFNGIYADGGRVGFAEGGAPAVPTTGGGFGGLYSGWAARGAPTGVAGSSLMPSFEAPTQRPALPTPPTAPDAGGMGGMNPMMMMGGGGKNSGMMMMLSMIQQQQAAAKYQQDMAKYNTALEAAKAAPRPVVGYTATSREYAIDPMTGLYAARGWRPAYSPLYADGGRVDELEGFDARKFHPELTRERGSERGVSEMSLGDADELMSAMQRRQQRTPRLRGGELTEDDDLTINPVGRGVVPGDPRDYEIKPTGVPLPPDRRPQEFEQPAARPGVDIDRGLAALRAIESSGRYGITGPRSRTGDRPYGAYQVMGANIPSWGREAGYENLTPQQFLASREIQDRVARVQYQKYLEKEGGNPEYAAANWIGGPGWRKHIGARDVLGTDAPEYMRRYRKAYASLGGTEPGGDEGGPAMAYGPTELASRHPGLGAIDANFRNSRETGGASGAPAQEERTGLGSMWSPEVQQGLLAAGLGMLASRSPHMGVAIGEGGLRGLQAYQAAKSGAGDAEYRRAQLEHLQTTTDLAREKFNLEKEALERKRKALLLLNQPSQGDEPAPPSAEPAPVGPAEPGPGLRPTIAPADKSWEERPRYDYGAPREAGAPAPEKASAPGAPMDIRPGAAKPAEKPAEPTEAPAAPVGEFKVPRAVQNKLREYNHWIGMAAAQEDEDVRAAYSKKAEAARFEYERGMAEAKDDYQRQFEREKYQTSEKRAAEEVDLKKKQADPAYQEDLERSKVLAKAEAEQIRDMSAAGRAARGAITTLNTLKELSGDINFDAGPLSGPATTAKQLLVQIGWADPKVTTANELFDSLANRTLKEQIGSLGAGISNADVQFMYKMVPTREKTVGGIREIVDYNTKLEQRKIDVAKFTRDWAKEHGNRLGPDYDEALEKWADAHPLFPEKAAKAQAGKEGAGPKVPAAAAAHLKANPNLREAFDQKYGQGAAASVLGE